ncbi:MAG TPA: MFS transporter [Verrucomicrobiae bacterium]|nr:MFS transporter [Verrucomicrobiae bacterium]
MNASKGALLLICYLGFVSLGLPDTVIGVAWPSVRREFGIEHSAIAWIFFGSGCSYFISSIFTGRMLRHWNVGVLLAGSSALVALAEFDFALARAWPLFALGAVLHGLGSGAIDSGLNHYVSTHFAARHMNWLHAAYSVGAMLGPLVMTAMITWRDSWRSGYMTVAITLLALAALFIGTRRRWDDPTPAESSVSNKVEQAVSAREVLRKGMVWMHLVLFFVYTGLEVALGQWSYTLLTEHRQIAPERAGIWVSVYWGSILAGRIGFGFVVDRWGVDRLIRLSTLAALAGAALFAWNPHPLLNPVALAIGGLGLASIFPCLMTRTPQRLGKAVAAHAIGFQLGAAMLGAAALPSTVGFIAANAGLQLAAPAIAMMAACLFLLHEVTLRAAAAKRP